MKKLTTVRITLGALLVAGGVVAACSNHTRTDDTRPQTPLGQSTAPGPSDPNMPQAGTREPDQPALPLSPRASNQATRGEVQTAQAEPMARDAGVGSSRGDAGGATPGGTRDAGAGGAGGARDGGVGGVAGDGGGVPRTLNPGTPPSPGGPITNPNPPSPTPTPSPGPNPSPGPTPPTGPTNPNPPGTP